MDADHLTGVRRRPREKLTPVPNTPTRMLPVRTWRGARAWLPFGVGWASGVGMGLIVWVAT